MDWNWFFSSLSQSAAAIVGIFGAFIITKILTNQATFSEKKNRLRELIAGAEKVKDDADSLYFNWYNKHTNNGEFEKIESLLEEGAEEDALHLYNRLNFSAYVAKSAVVESIERNLKARRERMQRELEEPQRRSKLFAGVGLSELPNLVNTRLALPSNTHISGDLTKEREAIERVIRDARHHIRLVSDFLDSVRGNPESSPQIAYALVLVTVLFYVGVIYPLSFMPVPQNAVFDLSLAAFFPLLFSLKGALLAAVSLVFTAALAMFFLMNVNMKHSSEDLEQLDAHTELGAYSEYFAVMEENEKAREHPDVG